MNTVLITLILAIGAYFNDFSMAAVQTPNPSDTARHCAWQVYGELENAPSNCNPAIQRHNGHDTCPAFQDGRTATAKGSLSTLIGHGRTRTARAEKSTATVRRSKPTASKPTAMGTEKAYLINFSAKWCGPCKRFHPTLEKMQKEGYNVQMVDGDENPDLCKAWGVERYPTTFLVKDNKVVKKWEGIVSEKELKDEYGPKE